MSVITLLRDALPYVECTNPALTKAFKKAIDVVVSEGVECAFTLHPDKPERQDAFDMLAILLKAEAKTSGKIEEDFTLSDSPPSDDIEDDFELR